ncbi:MAG: hypothetical protein WD768_13645 [Phycisphaeraceae bacterium]
MALALLLACSALSLAEEEAKDPVILDVKGDGVKRFEANQTQIGFSSTRIFYTLGTQSAVVVIHIDNSNKKFAADGKVYQFAKGVTPEDLGKWINNQHSDGLYPEVPEPVATHNLPADSIKTSSSKRVGQVKGGFRGDTYDKYTVEVEASTAELAKKLKLGAFKDSATVYMKAQAKE